MYVKSDVSHPYAHEESLSKEGERESKGGYNLYVSTSKHSKSPIYEGGREMVG